MTKRRHLVVLLIAAPLLSIGCGSKKYQGPSAYGTLDGVNTQTRVVIQTGSLELRAKELEAVKTQVDQAVADVKGWVDSWSLTERRWLRMTLRIPASELEATMNYISSLGRVVSRSLRSTDVTEQVIDLEARLKNLKALRDRLRSYMEQAQDLKEILAVEAELARVQSEIESIEGRLKVLRAQIEMSELRLAVRRR